MTRVAILWHMHQPFYQDLATGEHILPWVRLHGLKDYFGMAALTAEFPSLRLTFNLVPSLLVQIQAFAENRARDQHLEIGLKAAASLTDQEREFACANFFHAHRTRMIDPYPRYRELAAKRDAAVALAARLAEPLARVAARSFSETDLRDLQVWHKLAWLDPIYLEGDARVRSLIERGRGFSEDDKVTLRGVELELLNRVIPEYRAAAERGHVELSTSPFYHPILPLLCDTDVYLRTHPQSRMPRQPFRYPEDAAEQMERAAACHERYFGGQPRGLWPPEGSVSDQMVPLAAAGFGWMASDELILARTLGVSLTRDANGHLEQSEILYRPYLVRAGGREIACLFRDHTLSDLIGFTYAGWSADAAASDFASRLAEAGRRFSARTGGEEAVIAVILDGENAWEHYERGGRPFLRALYRRLASDPELKTVTAGEACRGATRRLDGIFPGSWINGDFYIWIGHPDDHRAWSQLGDARRALRDAGPDVAEHARAVAYEELLIAEGSDWFWWYGDDHSSEHDLAFDDLFRRHLRNVYRELGRPIPEELFVSNITTRESKADISQPTAFVHPRIDGSVTSYFEWIGAGVYEPVERGGVMRQAGGRRSCFVTAIHFGFDTSTMYVRVDLTCRADQMLAAGRELRLTFYDPGDLRVSVRQEGRAAVANMWEGTEVWTRRAGASVRCAAAEVVEVAVPFGLLGRRPQEPVAFFVAIHEGGTESERHPAHRPIEFDVPTEEFEAQNWSA